MRYSDYKPISDAELTPIHLYHLIKNLEGTARFDKGDARESIMAIQARLKELEKDSHVHITDKTIHKKSGK